MKWKFTKTYHEKGHLLQCLICDICDKNFNLKESLVRHKNKAHSKTSTEKEKQEFVCSICPKTFTWHGCKEHEESIHKQIKHFKECKICGKSVIN